LEFVTEVPEFADFHLGEFVVEIEFRLFECGLDVGGGFLRVVLDVVELRLDFAFVGNDIKRYFTKIYFIGQRPSLFSLAMSTSADRSLSSSPSGSNFPPARQFPMLLAW
jgi:hypothetical protein